MGNFTGAVLFWLKLHSDFHINCLTLQGELEDL